MPPSYLNSARRPSPRSSTKVMRSPRVRNAVSRRRCSMTSNSKSSDSKMSASARNVTVVPGVVHHFVDQVMQPARTGRADVHPGAFPHGLETLENRDVLGVVAGLRPLFRARALLWLLLRQRSS